MLPTKWPPSTPSVSQLAQPMSRSVITLDDSPTVDVQLVIARASIALPNIGKQELRRLERAGALATLSRESGRLGLTITSRMTSPNCSPSQRPTSPLWRDYFRSAYVVRSI